MKENLSSSPRIAALQRACADVGLTPEEVLQRAGLHRTAWYRWKAGTFMPSMRSWDAVQSVLVQAGSVQARTGQAA